MSEGASSEPRTLTVLADHALDKAGDWELAWFQVVEQQSGTEGDWTVDQETGRSNSSAAFNAAVDAVARLIRNSAHDLIGGRVESVATLIVAQLAHIHGFAPGRVSPESSEHQLDEEDFRREIRGLRAAVQRAISERDVTRAETVAAVVEWVKTCSNPAGGEQDPNYTDNPVPALYADAIESRFKED